MNASVMTIYPTVSCWKIIARCLYCKGSHKHGGGNGIRPYLGSRSADCGLGEYNLTVDSYSSVVGLPSDDPLVLLTFSGQVIAAGNGGE